MAFSRRVRSFFSTAVVAALFARAAKIQKDGLSLPDSASDNRQLVKEVFLDAYNAYKEHAWNHDDLAPVSAGFKDTRNGWGSSVFDALGTLKIMGEDDLFREAIEYASKVDFSHSNTPDHVSFFESTIRYLGGMLTAFDLNGQSDSALLANAQKLGDKLLFGWPAGYKTPVGSIDFSNNTPDVGDGGPNGLATAASNILEFYKLSQYTGNQTYLEMADMTMRVIATNPNPVFPGLPPLQVNKDGSGAGSTVNWDGGYDSYLEYLIKYARLTNFEDPLWAQTWTDAVESSIKNLVKQSTGGQYFLTSYDSDKGASYSMGDLACFAGGNWIMGGRLLDREDFVEWGLKITDACMSTYQTPTGLGPGAWAYKGADGGGNDPPADQKDFFDKTGFYITSAYYNVRPEVFESTFYAWRATGDEKYYNFAADGIRAMKKYMKSNVGYAPLKDVMRDEVTTDNQGDDLESFFFAEVMKYLYLTFDDPEHISLDTWVFNTESHPFLPANGTSTERPPAQTTPLPTDTDPAPQPTETDSDSCDEDDDDDEPAPATSTAPVPVPTDADQCEDDEEDGDEDAPPSDGDENDDEPCDGEDIPDPTPATSESPVPEPTASDPDDDDSCDADEEPEPSPSTPSPEPTVTEDPCEDDDEPIPTSTGAPAPEPTESDPDDEPCDEEDGQ